MNDDEPTWIEKRRKVHDALAAAFPDIVIGGWVLIFEEMKPEQGDTYYRLNTMSGDATGESDMRPWTSQGWCAIVGNDEGYFTGSTDEEEEDDEI